MKTTPLILALSLCGLSYAQQGPVAHYQFEKNLVDWTTTQAPATGNNISYVQDRFGTDSSAIAFNGATTSYVDCGNHSSLQIQNIISISCWIKLNSNNISGSRIISFEDEAGLNSSGYYIGTVTENNGYNLTFGFGQFSSPSEVEGGVILMPGVWYHVCVIADGSTMTIYVNGVMDTGIFYWPTSSNFISTLQLGRKSDTNYTPYNGALDDVRIYNRALTVGEVQQIYNTNPTGMQEEFRSELKVFPNPVTTNLHLVFSNSSENRALIIYDSKGKQVYSQDIAPGTSNASILFDHFAPGCYMVQLTTATRVQTLTFIKSAN